MLILQLLLLPEDSVLARYLHTSDKLFPSGRGWEGKVYTGPVSHASLPALAGLAAGLDQLVGAGILTAWDGWWPHYTQYLAKTNTSWQSTPFQSSLSTFLFSQAGVRFRSDFQLEGELECGQAAPPILATRY